MSLIWPNNDLKLQITTLLEAKLARGTKKILPIEFQQVAFNSRFSVRTNQFEQVNKVLNYNVPSLLIRLLDSTQPNELNISIKRGKLLIQKPGFLKDLLPLHNFIRYSLELFDQLMLFSTEGLHFLNENNATILESITCPICNGRIIEQMVICERCPPPLSRLLGIQPTVCYLRLPRNILSCDCRSLSNRVTQLCSQLLYFLSKPTETFNTYLARLYRD